MILIYEVFYIEETIIDGGVWEDGYHDDYYDYTIEQHIPVKYFQKRADAERYCDEIAQRTSQSQKNTIVRIKEELIAQGLYSFEKYKSLDVYKAVLENGVVDVEEFIELFE